MRVLIIGAKGMLGQDLMALFGADKKYQVLGIDQESIDITNRANVLQKIEEIKPNIVINTAAFTAVDNCEKLEFKKVCFDVNGYGVGYLASACKKAGAMLVHYSTDYIFAGDKAEGYKEDEKNFAPVNVYGESKLLGEQELQKNTDKFYLVRTAWLYGKNGKNFVDTMLALAQKMPELKVVDDQHGKPTYTVDLAKRTKEILESKMPFGIYHITNEGETTWCGFAKKIFELAGVKVSVKPVTSAEFPRPAKRPAYSALVNTKLSKMRKWEEALKEYLKLKG